MLSSYNVIVSNKTEDLIRNINKKKPDVLGACRCPFRDK